MPLAFDRLLKVRRLMISANVDVKWIIRERGEQAIERGLPKEVGKRGERMNWEKQKKLSLVISESSHNGPLSYTAR